MVHESPAPLDSAQRRTVGTIWLTYACSYLGRVNLSPALPAIAISLGISRGEVGIIGTAFFWLYALGQIINGELGSRISPHKIITLGLLTVITVNALFALQTSLILMLILWGINGYAQSASWSPMMGIIASRLSPTQAKRVSTIMPFSYLIGTVVTWTVAGILVGTFGWSSAFILPVIVLSAVLLYWRYAGIDAPKRKEKAKNDFKLSDIVSEWQSLWAILIVGALIGFVNVGAVIWLPTYVSDTGLFPDTLVGMVAAMMQVLALFGMFIAHKTIGRAKGVLVTTAGLLSLTGIAYFLSLPLPQIAQLILIAGGLIGINGAGGLLVSSIPIILASEGRTSAVAGAINALANVGGGIAGFTIGALVEASSWNVAFTVWGICAFIAGGILWLNRNQEQNSNQVVTS